MFLLKELFKIIMKLFIILNITLKLGFIIVIYRFEKKVDYVPVETVDEFVDYVPVENH